MKKLMLLSLVLIIGAASLNSCKKYEEGPGFSLRSKTARLTGDWRAKEYTLDGESLLVNIEEIEGFSLEISLQFDLTIDKDGTTQSTSEVSSSTTFLGVTTTQESKETEAGTWKWGTDKESVIFTDYDGDEEEFEIIKLSTSELIFEQIDEDEKMRIVLEKR